MRKDKEQAAVLRKSGMSYSEIMARMAVPKSTLSSWFKSQKWSNDIAIDCIRRSNKSAATRLTVLNTIRGNRLKKIYEEARQDALVDYTELKFHPLFVAGIMLYSAHGNMTSSSKIVFSCSRAASIRIFKLFLEKVCNVSKIRVQLMIPEGNSDENEIKNYWISKTGLKSENFIKCVHIKRNESSIKPSYGVCNLIVNSAYLKNKFLRWIELLSEEIGNENLIAGIV